MCGYAATVAMLVGLRDLGAKEAALIRHATSGDITGEREGSRLRRDRGSIAARTGQGLRHSVSVNRKVENHGALNCAAGRSDDDVRGTGGSATTTATTAVAGTATSAPGE